MRWVMVSLFCCFFPLCLYGEMSYPKLLSPWISFSGGRWQQCFRMVACAGHQLWETVLVPLKPALRDLELQWGATVAR